MGRTWRSRAADIQVVDERKKASSNLEFFSGTQGWKPKKHRNQAEIEECVFPPSLWPVSSDLTIHARIDCSTLQLRAVRTDVADPAFPVSPLVLMPRPQLIFWRSGALTRCLGFSPVCWRTTCTRPTHGRQSHPTRDYRSSRSGNG